MKLIVGLGNIGAKYLMTRHNLGFMVLDILIDRVLPEKKIDLPKSKLFIKDDLFLAKPKTFMNRSGEAVEELFTHFQFTIQDLLVIHDDLDLPFGRIKIKKGGGAAGHRGIISIIEALSNTEFGRIRMGIGRPRGDTREYVLGRFSEDELDKLPDFLSKAADAALVVVREGIEVAMNIYNRKEVSDGL